MEIRKSQVHVGKMAGPSYNCLLHSILKMCAFCLLLFNKICDVTYRRVNLKT